MEREKRKGRRREGRRKYVPAKRGEGQTAKYLSNFLQKSDWRKSSGNMEDLR